MKKILYCLLLIFTFTIKPITVHADDTPVENVIEIDATSAIVMSIADEEILYSQNIDDIVYPASMTKMMTVLIGLEKIDDLSQTITITSDMFAGLYEENASLAGLQVGDEVTLEDILYAIALPSGAEACNALISYTYGDKETFVNEMNKKAKELGLTNTHFSNATGLHDDNHYTTVYDMALLLKYCLNNSQFYNIFSSSSYTTTSGLVLYSTLFSSQQTSGYALENLVGGKTGFTFEAGHCLASWAECENVDLIIVTVGGSGGFYEPSHIASTDTLLNVFSGYKRFDIFKKQSKIHDILINHPISQDETQSIIASEDIYVYALTSQTVTSQIDFVDTVDSLRNEQILNGSLSITVDDTLVETIPLQTTIEKEQHWFDAIILFFMGK